MTIYVDINGMWGPADELVFIDDSRWEVADYELLERYSTNWVLNFSASHGKMTPREWAGIHDVDSFLSTGNTDTYNTETKEK
jgi:hypothetical protein